MAVFATVAALVLRAVLEPWLGASSPFLFFTAAVMLSAWYGGLGPGLLSTAAGAALINFFLLEPLGQPSLTRDDVSRIVLFLAVSCQISWLSGAMHDARRRAEADAQSARRSERLYRMLASNFPDGFVCLFDEQMRWTLVAGAGLSTAGLSRQEMEGRPIAETMSSEPAAAPVREMCAGAMNGSARAREIVFRSRVYFTHALPLRTQDETEHVGMIIFEDVTERVRAREALQAAHDTLEQRVAERTAELRFQRTLLESQIEAAADGILAVGQDGTIIFANRRFSEIWRTPPGLAGTRVDRLAPAIRDQRSDPEQPDPLAAASASLPVGEPGDSDQLVLTDGRTIERYSAPIVDADGTSYGRVWFFRDVTERKRMQREVLEAAERERQRFGHDLHDDLCQRLAGIACLAQVLQQQLSAAPGADQEAAHAGEIVQLLHDANNRARDLARGLQPIDLRQQGLKPALQQLCSAVQARFQVDCAYRATGDNPDLGNNASIHLYRICQEAISNAVRHGRPRRVVVDLSTVGDRLILTVADDGRGIPEPLPQHGLGLYTMSYRAQMMGGSVTVERRMPQGTVVTCSMPIPVPADAPAASEAGNESRVAQGAPTAALEPPPRGG
jgi:PAS domain S-box-containing protein